MEINKRVYPRWIGMVFGFFLPGSAHFLSGHKSSGLIWYFGLLIGGQAAGLLMRFPSRSAVIAGLAFMLCVAFFSLYMLVSSFRPVERLRGKQWIALVAFLILTYLLPDPIQIFNVSGHSMNPSLLGLYTQQGTNETSFADGLLRGTVYEEIKITAPGTFTKQPTWHPNGIELHIGDQTYPLPRGAMPELNDQKIYETGDILWSGTVTSSNHITVNPFAYCFKKPSRGDLVVYKTDSIEHPHVKTKTLYLHRIVGLPGETIRIQPPRILINDNTLTTPPIFLDLNYMNAGQLEQEIDSITLSDHEYFVLGDNTSPDGSLDSRYFGAISEDSIMGRVSTIYWPLNRIGPVR